MTNSKHQSSPLVPVCMTARVQVWGGKIVTHSTHCVCVCVYFIMVCSVMSMNVFRLYTIAL